MNILTKKRMMGLTAGIVILAGALTPFVVQADAEEDPPDQPPAMHQRHFDPDKMAQGIADTFGVSKEEVLRYDREGLSFHDLSKAAFLAKASGKSLKEVMETKTYDNTWKDVAQSLGVTQEQMKATHNELAATRLEAKLHLSKNISLDLMQKGYHARDIAIANAVANHTGKPIIDVLAMKQINNSWHDVASGLGVDDNTFRQDMKALREVFHPGEFPGHHPFMM